MPIGESFRIQGSSCGMAPPKKKIELHSNAWARFERAIGVVAKSPPQHRQAKPKKAKESRPSKTKKRRKTKAI
jgi:hypothetical protein